MRSTFGASSEPARSDDLEYQDGLSEGNRSSSGIEVFRERFLDESDGPWIESRDSGPDLIDGEFVDSIVHGESKDTSSGGSDWADSAIDSSDTSDSDEGETELKENVGVKAVEYEDEGEGFEAPTGHQGEVLDAKEEAPGQTERDSEDDISGEIRELMERWPENPEDMTSESSDEEEHLAEMYENIFSFPADREGGRGSCQLAGRKRGPEDAASLVKRNLLSRSQRRRLGLDSGIFMGGQREQELFQTEGSHGWVIQPAFRRSEARQIRELVDENFSNGARIRALEVEAEAPVRVGDPSYVERYTAMNVQLGGRTGMNRQRWRKHAMRSSRADRRVLRPVPHQMGGDRGVSDESDDE